MAPRGLTQPAPQTESARQARKSFFCELCQKGYSRMNEFEAHESSYDHQHKRRLKEMKNMSRDPNAADKARRAERKADEKSGLISIKLDDATTSKPSGFKKGSFKSAFGGASATVPGVLDSAAKDDTPASRFKKIGGPPSGATTQQGNTEGTFGKRKSVKEEPIPAPVMPEKIDYEYYDPRRPTSCDQACEDGEMEWFSDSTSAEESDYGRRSGGDYDGDERMGSSEESDFEERRRHERRSTNLRRTYRGSEESDDYPEARPSVGLGARQPAT